MRVSVAYLYLLLTQVKRVYILARPRRGVPPGERLARLLEGPLFHELHAAAAAAVARGERSPFERVVVVDGDLSLPALGLAPADVQRITAEVGVVLHCAADLDLDAPIQKTLRCVHVLCCKHHYTCVCVMLVSA